MRSFQHPLPARLAPARSLSHALHGLAGALLVAMCAGARAAPTITLQPQNTVVSAGQNATLTVAATGTGALSYQWRRNGLPIVGATNNTFVQAGMTRGEADYYDVLVTDATGQTVSQNVFLSVAPTNYPTPLTRDPAWDLEFELENHFGDIVAVAPTPDGGFVAAGRFSRVNSARRSSVMKVRADGTLDPLFVPATLSGGDVVSMAVQPDGKVLVGGRFGQVGGQVRNGLVRLNADGSLDSSFNPNLDNSVHFMTAIVVQSDGRIVFATWGGATRLHRRQPDGSVDHTYSGVSGVINALALQPDGKLVAAGNFTAASPGGIRNQVARFNADGTLDANFDAGTGGNAVPLTVAIQPDGRVVVGGTFTAFSGRSVSGLVRLSSSGAVDPTFGDSMSGNWEPSIRAIVALPDGKLLIGGNMIGVQGSHYIGLVRLTSSGAVDMVPAAPPSHLVHAVAVLPDGKMVVGGYFSAAGTETRAGLARYLPNGAIDPIVNFTFRRNGFPTAAVAAPGGKYLAMGAFDTVNGIPRRGLVRLNSNGTIDSSFDSGRGTEFFPGIPGYPTSAAVLPDGRIAITGTFTSVDGTSRHHVAVLHRDGALDRTFVPSTGLELAGAAIAVLPGGRLVVVGKFERANGAPARGIAVFKPDGSLDPSFVSGSGFAGEPRTVGVQPDGRIVVGGTFSMYNGATAHNLARLNADGTLDAGFNSETAPGSTVGCIRVLPGGKLIVTGWLNWVDGLNRGSVARLNADGRRDSAFAGTAIWGVSSAVAQEDGKILIRVTSPSDATGGAAVVRLKSDGTIDESFRAIDVAPPHGSSTPGSLVMRDNGQLIICDEYTFVGTTTGGGPVLTIPPASQTVAIGGTVTLSVAVDSLLPATYEWFFNSIPITGATGPSHTIAGFHGWHAGSYIVRVTNAFGSTTSAPAVLRTPLTRRGRISNMSIRSSAGTGDRTLIVGLVLGGADTGGNKEILFRGVGETLAETFGVASALRDPRIELYNSGNFKIDENDDWAGVFDFGSVGAFGFARNPTKDAAIYNPFAFPDSTSIHVLGRNAAVGVVLAEIYDATPPDRFTVTTPRLINVSARTHAGVGDEVLIAGFVVAGETSVRVLIRGVAETLAQPPFSLTGVLSNPRLELYDGAGVKIAENDDWITSGGLELPLAFSAVGAFPLRSPADAALLATLPPGNYTAQVRGAGDSTGIALVEIYELP